MSSSETSRLTWLSGEALALALPLLTAGLGVAGLLVVSGRVTSLAEHLVMIIGMTLAMMSPFAIPLARAVGRATLWWHAPAAVLIAVLVFLGGWVLAATGLHLLGSALASLITPTAAIALLTASCVAGQIGHGRQRLLLTCRVTRPFYQDQHVRGSLQWGCLAAVRCVRACACPMILTAVQPSLAGFAAVAVLLWTERFAGRQLRLPLALGYLGIGAAMLFTMGPAGLATLFAHLQHH